MTDRAVHFEHLEVHRVLGIRRGEGFALSELSPGVNLIHGPNGCGKTTAARVIQELLWPGRTGLERPSIAGRFRTGGEVWHIDIDAGHPRCASDGSSGMTPQLGPPENRHRYCLALHELIQDDNAAFAKIIADDSQGGYDLEAAQDRLGFRERPQLRSREKRELQDRRAHVTQARDRQLEVERDACRLTALRAEHHQAIAAQQSLVRLQQACQYREADEACRRMRIELATLPEGVSRLHGNERQRLDQLAARRDELAAARERERARVQIARDALRDADLPEGGVDGAVLRRLGASVAQLDSLALELRQQERTWSEAVSAVDAARRRIGEHLTDGQLVAVDALEVGALSALARQADRVRGEEAVLAERRRWLDREEPDEIRGLDRQRLQEGVSALARWLASPAPANRWPWFLILMAGVAVILSMVLARVHHPLWSMAAMAGVLTVAADWWNRGRTGAAPGRVHRQTYESTSLPLPVSWEAPAVAELLRRLHHLAALCTFEDERRRRLAQLEAETEALAERRSRLGRQRRDLEQRLGVSIQLDDEWLPVLVDNISAWQQNRDKAAGATQAIEQHKAEQRRLLDEISRALDPFGYERVDSAELAARMVQELAGRQERHRDASRDLAGALRHIEETIEPEFRSIGGECRALFERLGLEEEDEARIDDWLAERPRYQELSRQLADAEAVRNSHRAALAEYPALLEMDAVELQQQIADQQAIADRRDDLTDRIARTERDIEEAKRGHELSDALKACAAAADRLADAREENCRAVAGAVLTDWVRRVAIERSRPGVFGEANRLLAAFTQGALSLDVHDASGPASFRARRGSEPPCPVDELSVGERVQLLMAVRVAFLEYHEPARLPLLLDEALGTSDDGRAGVIIDSVIQIAAAGRQVFYFTAQRDEVGKWLSRLREAGCDHRMIDLAQVRRLAAAAGAPLEITAVELPEPPAPDGMSYEAYGRLLGVPAVDPAADSLDGLHLWHLLDDAGVLHQLLRRRISAWSQLRTLLEHGGAGLLDGSDRALRRAGIVALALEAACRAWRIGRGRPVDRAALLESAYVSPAFIDQLAELAKDVEGDAQRLLVGLESGHVPRWRTANTDRLREFFEAGGYLPEIPPLTLDEIRPRVLAAVADDLAAGRIEQLCIERIIAALPNGAQL